MNRAPDLSLPHWDLSNIYSGLNSEKFLGDYEKLSGAIQKIDTCFQEKAASNGPQTDITQLSTITGELIDLLNHALELSQTIGAFLTGYTAVDSYNTDARRFESQYQVQSARLDELVIRFCSWAGAIKERLPEIIQSSQTAQAHAFALKEAADRSHYLMQPGEEALAAELSLSGGQSWHKLQGTITSQLTIDFELDGEVRKLSMPALINLRTHPNESTRRRAYEAEMKAWASVREPLAAAMNGIKGETITLFKRRSRSDALHSALEMSRIDRETLDAMLDAIVDSLPAFRRYFHSKARRLEKTRLPWWDIFAPTGNSEKIFTWEDSREFILENFVGFSPALADFARHAMDHNWIDAEPRSGKRGGAFCMGLPAVKESRILANFDGSLDQVSTVAHELGHGFHNYCIYKAGKTALQSQTPMTLAETASIMNETIILQATLEQAANPIEKLSFLDTSLIGDAQIIVDIYSRFLFEKEVFNRREKAELSADELCEIMNLSQKEAYGDGLDERFLHPYMWTWKPHYYYPDLSFYNFPYAFGLLFGTGLYAIYQQRGSSFIPDYMDLLASTGEGTAAQLADRFGINIQQKGFWANSLQVIEKKIDQYVTL